jgi:hypothetical protein
MLVEFKRTRIRRVANSHNSLPMSATSLNLALDAPEVDSDVPHDHSFVQLLQAVAVQLNMYGSPFTHSCRLITNLLQRLATTDHPATVPVIATLNEHFMEHAEKVLKAMWTVDLRQVLQLLDANSEASEQELACIHKTMQHVAHYQRLNNFIISKNQSRDIHEDAYANKEDRQPSKQRVKDKDKDKDEDKDMEVNYEEIATSLLSVEVGCKQA